MQKKTEKDEQRRDGKQRTNIKYKEYNNIKATLSSFPIKRLHKNLRPNYVLLPVRHPF